MGNTLAVLTYDVGDVTMGIPLCHATPHLTSMSNKARKKLIPLFRSHIPFQPKRLPNTLSNIGVGDTHPKGRHNVPQLLAGELLLTQLLAENLLLIHWLCRHQNAFLPVRTKPERANIVPVTVQHQPVEKCLFLRVIQGNAILLLQGSDASGVNPAVRLSTKNTMTSINLILLSFGHSLRSELHTHLMNLGRSQITIGHTARNYVPFLRVG